MFKRLVKLFDQWLYNGPKFEPEESKITDSYESLWRAYTNQKPSSLEEYTHIKNRPEEKIRYILTFYHSGAAEPIKAGSLRRFSEYLDELDWSEYHY
jgi:hypothetical protein